MSGTSPQAQLGEFIVQFQALEQRLSAVIVLLTGADDEYVYALLAGLEYSNRLKAADVIFARFVGITANTDSEAPKEFHKLMVELLALGERRNTLVHSHYHPLITTGGALALARENRRLRASKGTQEQENEDILPNSLSADLARLWKALARLEQFRLRIIEWRHPC